MSKNLDKLKGHSEQKQDINRRADVGEINGKEGKVLQKRLDDLKRVISNPDVWNANIASRDRMDRVEQKLDDLLRRIEGVSYIMRNLVRNKRLTEKDLEENLSKERKQERDDASSD